MEYLRPIEQLKQLAKLYQVAILVLAGLLGISLVAVPSIVKKENPIVINEDSVARIAEVDPWKITTTRMEGFAKLYLLNRFEWNREDFSRKKEKLKSITTDSVYQKYKESFTQFEALAQNQAAKSYYVLEGFGFSNAQKKIEVRITRIIRIRNVGMATPLTVRLSYQETAVNAENPYGLIIDGIEESEVPSDAPQGAGQ